MRSAVARLAVPLASAVLVAVALTGCERSHPAAGTDASGDAATNTSATTQAPAPAPSASAAGSSSLDQDDADLDAVDGAVAQSGGDLGAADQAAQSGDAP